MNKINFFVNLLESCEKIIEITLPTPVNEYQKSNLSQYSSPIEFMQKEEIFFIPLKILKPFHFKFFWYQLTTFNENAWNCTNPFWLLWKIFKLITFCAEWLWGKNKILFLIIGGVGAFLVFDYSLAWKNFKIFLQIIGLI